jgi:hypothetical protein
MAPAEIHAVTWQFLCILASVATAAACLAWFISAQFSANRSLFYRALSMHNREDDDRFESLSGDIWRIHLRNAARDGDDAPERKTFPRRRYLQEAVDERSL